MKVIDPKFVDPGEGRNPTHIQWNFTGEAPEKGFRFVIPFLQDEDLVMLNNHLEVVEVFPERGLATGIVLENFATTGKIIAETIPNLLKNEVTVIWRATFQTLLPLAAGFHTYNVSDQLATASGAALNLDLVNCQKEPITGSYEIEQIIFKGRVLWRNPKLN